MINQEEYEILKELDDKWKWIARDGFKGELNVYNVRPTRSYFKNWWFTNEWFGRGKTILPYFFPFIQWTDSEPYFIPDLIEEYEDRGDIGYTSEEYAEYLSKINEKFLKESEEEMKKDKKWLKEEIESKFHRWYDSTQTLNSLIANVNNLIDQLDEPEVLSQEWVDDNSVYASSDGITEEYVHVDDLQNLLVPKQELPVIPKFVADWMEENSTGRYSWWKKIAEWESEVPDEDRKVYDWYAQNNEDTFIIAWLDGFEVEKEQLYYVVKEDVVMALLEKFDGVVRLTRAKFDDVSCIGPRYMLTEKEIKDYDERFWAFAVPVEVAE